MKASIVSLKPFFSVSDGLRLAEGLEVGDVGLVELRDVRDRDPVAVQVGAGELLDARQRLRLDRAELGEVDLRPGRQVERQRRRRLARAGAGLASKRALHEGLHVLVQDAALRVRCP